MVDQLLGGLFGAQDDDDAPKRQARANDFIDRVQRGAHDQISADEALQNYRATTAKLTPEQYQQAAEEAFKQMSPEERRQLRKEMRKHSRAQARQDDDDDDSPAAVAKTMQQVQQEHEGSGGLAGLFGLGGSDAAATVDNAKSGVENILSNPLAKVALAGIAAMAAKKLSEPHR